MRIRHGKEKDIEALSCIEMASYPAEEGAPKETIAQRIKVFPDGFWLLEDQGQILSFVNGMRTEAMDLCDDMYANNDMYDAHGLWLMIFSVVTRQDCRKKGYAHQVMRQVIDDEKISGLKGIVLTCKEPLIGFYETFGFVNEGISHSTHGRARWYQMRLRLNRQSEIHFL